MLTCYDVASYFLHRTDDEDGDGISNLKLQKLVYYVQGFHLALHNNPMFSEKIQAWAHGPVVPELYHHFKDHGAAPIPRPDDLDLSIYDIPARELLDEVYDVFGQYSAWKLREMTHGEPPWKDAYAAGSSRTITHQSLKAYFKTLLKPKRRSH